MYTAGNLAAFPLGFILPLSLALKHSTTSPISGLGEENKTVISCNEMVFRGTLLGLSAVLMTLQTFGSVISVIV